MLKTNSIDITKTFLGYFIVFCYHGFVKTFLDTSLLLERTIILQKISIVHRHTSVFRYHGFVMVIMTVEKKKMNYQDVIVSI